MEKHALLIANSASMIDHFNKDNIRILQDMGYTISVAANFQEGNSSTVERIHAFASELAAQDIELQDIRRIHRALGTTCANQRMQFIHK